MVESLMRRNGEEHDAREVMEIEVKGMQRRRQRIR